MLDTVSVTDLGRSRVDTTSTDTFALLEYCKAAIRALNVQDDEPLDYKIEQRFDLWNTNQLTLMSANRVARPALLFDRHEYTPEQVAQTIFQAI